MALKFLNKKGWHTGSLRNIENVWKAEQKHDAEQKKLEELRKQIQEERERAEFRFLQEQAGLVPKQERLEFLYDSGLAVGKASSSDGFKALETFPKTDTSNNANAPSSSTATAKQTSSAPGALFEEKPHSANDTWRKLHSDPLLMIRQREQEALARVKNNPIQMAMIRKSVESKKLKKAHDKKQSRKKHRHGSSKRNTHSSPGQKSDSEDASCEGANRRTYTHKKRYNEGSDSETDSGKKRRGKKNRSEDSKYKDSSTGVLPESKNTKFDGRDAVRRNYEARPSDASLKALRQESHNRRHNAAPKLSEEERAARLREMQADADLHEEQRWKRLRKAEEADAQEATRCATSGGRNFLDAAHKSVYGTDMGGSATIEESVRRRTHYSQGRSEAREGNAFRR
ncbi:uncharacterized protein LOC131149002 isoform X2 [Malania oleifera]|uniref:uncharacterized protein LOC131149002 isoform X2 n=1 Tax=Malania oleifera TaxID=397392 RepID=UPI0025AE20C7|nr:uncharacterized protein LOC131149002 isoform X2 [Malania oleifera]